MSVLVANTDGGSATARTSGFSGMDGTVNGVASTTGGRDSRAACLVLADASGTGSGAGSGSVVIEATA